MAASIENSAFEPSDHVVWGSLKYEPSQSRPPSHSVRAGDEASPHRLPSEGDLRTLMKLKIDPGRISFREDLSQRPESPAPHPLEEDEESSGSEGAADLYQEDQKSRLDQKQLEQKQPQRNLAVDPNGATTLMIRNLPYSVTCEELLQAVDASGFASLYSFVYLPHKIVGNRNLGFAFINFVNADAATQFQSEWHKSRHLKAKGNKAKSINPLNVSLATVQCRTPQEFKAYMRKIDRAQNKSWRGQFKSNSSVESDQTEKSLSAESALRACLIPSRVL